MPSASVGHRGLLGVRRSIQGLASLLVEKALILFSDLAALSRLLSLLPISPGGLSELRIALIVLAKGTDQALSNE